MPVIFTGTSGSKKRGPSKAGLSRKVLPIKNKSESSKSIVFDLKGKRLKGKYSLVHLRDKQWLLIKL
jgi:hypothetical protein